MAALESDEEAFHSLDSLSDAGEETAESRKELAEATPVKTEDEKETNIDKEEELDEEEAEVSTFERTSIVTQVHHRKENGKRKRRKQKGTNPSV